jgi:hypothetical protein
MPDPPAFDYQALLRASLLRVVREVMERVAAEGLPRDHHFYLTFGTREPGVVMAPRLLKQHPEEMTIVLQHQFSGLAADDRGLSVTLRFGGTPERITVPWEALRAFVDPSVGFGLKLRPEPARPSAEESAAEPRSAPPAPAEAAAVERNVVDFGAYRRRSEGPEA